jgi:hypothetical protein
MAAKPIFRIAKTIANGHLHRQGATGPGPPWSANMTSIPTAATANRPADGKASSTTGVVTGAPALLLRMEGAAMLIAATLGYAMLGPDSGWGWTAYLALLLAPDVAMLGYLAGPRVGAISYNAAHTYLAPAVLAGSGVLLGAPGAVAISLIWAAHIGFDRMLGYGLKYSTAFKATHLGAPSARR